VEEPSPTRPSPPVSAALLRLPATALRACLREGITAATLRGEVMAGAVVGTVALPLAMALAIASGVPPQHGLYTAIVGGFVIAALGGSRVLVSGPTAAFVVVLAPIAERFGLGGLLLATMMAGLLLIVMGLSGMGGFVEFVPYPVTTGFTSGIALVIATLQVRDLLGLQVAALPEHYLEKVGALARALPSLTPADAIVGLLTLLVLLLWPRLDKRVPAPLVALLAGAVAGLALAHVGPAWQVATLGSRFSYELGGHRFGGIPPLPPLPLLPWHLPGPDGQPVGLSLALLRHLAPSAFAIAMLGAIESLLAAVVADGMTHQRHDPDAELLAQGLGNVVAPLFGGIAATGALARTATNVRAGGRTPVAAMLHAVFVLLAVLALARWLAVLPMAALAALLLIVAWNMSEARHFVEILRTAPRSDVLVLLTCAGLTVVFDMVVSVTAGIMLAALLFMRRMAEVSGVRLVGSRHPSLDQPLPPGVLLYDVAGPLFFGAAQKAMSALAVVEKQKVKVIILDIEDVPAIDATGLVALESLIHRLNGAGIKVILVGVEGQPLHALAKAGFRNRKGRLRIFRSFERGVAVARRTVDPNASGGPGTDTERLRSIPPGP
jgi:SulP family sulfate permease